MIGNTSIGTTSDLNTINIKTVAPNGNINNNIVCTGNFDAAPISIEEKITYIGAKIFVKLQWCEYTGTWIEHYRNIFSIYP